MSRRRRNQAGPRPSLELKFDELSAIVERTKIASLNPEDHAKL